MTSPDFPDGTYFSVIGNVRLGTGGQTRLALMRHRLFCRQTEHELPILTFNPVPSYEPVRAGLLEQGLLLPESRLLNMHEDLRVRPLEGTGPEIDAAPGEDDVDDGYVWRRRSNSHWDYLRPDGSLYARTPPADLEGPAAVFDRAGRKVASWPTLGGLWTWWATQMMPAEGRVFFLSDSRFVAEELSRIDDERVFVLHQMHNPHTVGARRWNSNISETYRASMESLGGLDALISLTDRQRDDVRLGFGDTTNLFVIPNPVEPPPLPATVPERDPMSIVMIARLTSQKRVDRGIEAFAAVIRALPDATLDIYGDGPLRTDLQRQIDHAGLNHSVTLRGHDPHAREAMWEASAFWVTSQFEGFPLVIAEARSHGCPVLSFDIKYGAREQIDDGDDGFLIPAGDTDGLAAATVALLEDPVETARIGEAGRARAADQGGDRFLADWADVVNAAVDLKGTRTTVSSASWSTALRNADPITFEGTLRLDTPMPERLDEVVLSAIAYAPDREDVIEVPLAISRTGSVFTFSGRVDERRSRVRVGYAWHNNAGTVQVLPDDFALPRSLRRRVDGALRRVGLRR